MDELFYSILFSIQHLEYYSFWFWHCGRVAPVGRVVFQHFLIFHIFCRFFLILILLTSWTSRTSWTSCFPEFCSAFSFLHSEFILCDFDIVDELDELFFWIFFIFSLFSRFFWIWSPGWVRRVGQVVFRIFFFFTWFRIFLDYDLV